MKKKYEINEEESKKIRKKIREYEKAGAFRKLQAIMLIGEGESVESVAKITLYHKTYVYNLIKQYCTKSFEDFVKDDRGGANHRNLSDEQKADIINKFEKRLRKAR
jgi:transposase